MYSPSLLVLAASLCLPVLASAVHRLLYTAEKLDVPEAITVTAYRTVVEGETTVFVATRKVHKCTTYTSLVPSNSKLEE